MRIDCPDVRAATPDDAVALAELRWEFRAGREAATEAHDAFIERCATWMRQELTSVVAWRAWIAVRDGQAIGQVWLNTLPKIPNPVSERECHTYVSNLYVKPSERGGTGTRLLEASLAWSREHQADRVILWPSGRSVSLYARHGFVRPGDVMELALGKPRNR